MVRSSSSCFKIITCSSDSVEDDDDDLEHLQRKGSTDKRRWSFRKSSDRHQVLNSTMISETLSTENKENPESSTVDFKKQSYLAVPEKNSASQLTEDLKPLPDAMNSKASDTLIVTENASKGDPSISLKGLIETDSAAKVDTKIEESAVVIQAAIRGYLAQRAFLKHKNVIKLQAAFRGLLVRRQAVGTLRCVQAIIKMQSLVRARRARMSLDGSVAEQKFDETHDQSVKPVIGGVPGTKEKSKFSSTEKLLGNGFARQLLESMPKKKPIRVKCDPLRPDSAWKWLERWVSVSSSDFAQPQKPESNCQNEEQIEVADGSTSEMGTEILAEVLPGRTNWDSKVLDTETSVEGEKNMITYDADNFQFQFCPTTSSIGRNDPEEPSALGADQNELQPDGASNQILDSISSKPEADSEPPKHSMKRVESEQPESEGKKIVVGSRKTCNPAFVAAQSKFEELSLSATAGRSIASNHDLGLELKSDNISPSSLPITRTKELIPIDSSSSHDLRVHIGGTGCGTDHFISSTPGSPGRSEVANVQHENDSKVPREVFSSLNATMDYASNLQNLDDEANEESPALQTNSSHAGEATNTVCANGEAAASVYFDGEATPVHVNEVVASAYANGQAIDSISANGENVVSALDANFQQAGQPERSVSNGQIQLDTAEDRQAHKSSPDGSPRSHIAAAESHGTPSSQLSVDSKKKKVNKSEPTQKRKSRSEFKSSPSNANQDSGGRSSTEQVPKDSKNGKRRNSFGMAKFDHGDQESRDSNSSLPSYMQATQSAKAKAQANISPRSSPDVQDSELYIKKRHSLPNANGKQGSPRIQSTTPPQPQQGTKGQRERWQR